MEPQASCLTGHVPVGATCCTKAEASRQSSAAAAATSAAAGAATSAATSAAAAAATSAAAAAAAAAALSGFPQTVTVRAPFADATRSAAAWQHWTQGR